MTDQQKREKKLADAEWREKLRDATELLEMFKHAAYLDHTI